MFKNILYSAVAIVATITSTTFAVSEDANSNRIHLEAKQGGFNKYEYLVDKSLNFKSSDPTTWYQSLSQAIFGKTTEQKRFDVAAEKFYKKQLLTSSYGKGHLGDTSVGLRTELGTMWVGPILMGREQKQMNVVYDTGSDWLVVFGANCTNCNGTKLDPLNSGVPTTSGISERQYGSASLSGREYTDEVCIDFRTCVKDFEYFNILSQKGLNPPIEGILGMSQNSSSAMEGKAFVEVGPLLVEKLREHGNIDEPIFSFYMQAKQDGRSHVDFGRPDKSAIKDQAMPRVAYLKMNRDLFWSSYLQAVAFGRTNGQGGFRMPNEKYTIFDSGSSHIFVPNNYFNVFLDKMVAESGAQYQTKQGIVVAECRASWNSIWFMFDNYWLEIQPKEFLVDVSENGDRSVCHILIIGNNYDFFLFGLPIYQGYYTIHDMWRESLGFAPHDHSEKHFLKKDALPVQVLELPAVNYALQIAIILVILFGFIGVAVVSPWASNLFGSGTENYKVAIIVYGCICLVLFLIIMTVANNVGFSNVGGATLDMSDDYGPDNVPEGDNYDYTTKLIGSIGAVSAVYFVAKMFIMTKSGNARNPKNNGERNTLI